MVLTQVNYYEKLQFMLFIIIMANYFRFSNTIPNQLEEFIKNLPTIFGYVWVPILGSKRNTQYISLADREALASDINHKVLHLKGKMERKLNICWQNREVRTMYKDTLYIAKHFLNRFQRNIKSYFAWKQFHLTNWK